MVGGEAVAIPPVVPPVPARVPGTDGLRVVTRENGRFCDLMPSALSFYLLPTLADFSLVRRETRSPVGALRFTGDAVELVEIGGGIELSGLRVLLAEMTAGFGSVGVVTQILLETPTGSAVDPSVSRPMTGIATVPMTTLTLPNVTPATAVAAAPVGAATAKAVEATTPAASPAPDAPVAEIASRIATLSELSDELLAELFTVERETFCRWRTGALTNPRIGNRRRLGLLLALLEELHTRQVNIKDWLLNSVTAGGLTPYQLLARGRIDEVAYLAATIGQPTVERDARIAVGLETEPLEFGDDDVWELEPLDDDEQ